MELVPQKVQLAAGLEYLLVRKFLRRQKRQFLCLYLADLGLPLLDLFVAPLLLLILRFPRLSSMAV